MKWLLSCQEPDFRTISNFRKNNTNCLKKVFHEFNCKVSSVFEKGFLSIDGSKFQADNSKDNNFTANKLEDRMQWLNRHTDEYLHQIADMDELEKKLQKTTERLECYKTYQKYMEENGLSQMSLIDTDARLMKSKNGFMVAYNVQTAVDSGTHLIEDYRVINQPTAHGLIGTTMDYLKGQADNEIQEAVADKGYNVAEDMVKCLENGIIPHVILPERKDTYELELTYEQVECDSTTVKSKTPEDLKKCLHTGVIPEAYREVTQRIEVVEKRRLVKEELEEKKQCS